jgi:hypothetical protein
VIRIVDDHAGFRAEARCLLPEPGWTLPRDTAA